MYLGQNTSEQPDRLKPGISPTQGVATKKHRHGFPARLRRCDITQILGYVDHPSKIFGNRLQRGEMNVSRPKQHDDISCKRGPQRG